MGRTVVDWFRWLLFSGSIRIYPGNILKLPFFWLGKAIRRVAWLGNVFVAYVKNPNILTLLIVLVLVGSLGFVYSYFHTNIREISAPEIAMERMQQPTNGVEEKKQYDGIDWRKGHALKWSLQSMFDPSFALSNFKNDGRSSSIVDGIVALSLFLFTWLIGGGALISSIITTMQENHHGAWRNWSFLLWNHSLIIGWNDNAPTIIKEHLEANRMPLVKTPFGTWRPKRPELLLVITSGDAYEVSKNIELTIGTFLQRLRISYDVYRGSYDDNRERKRLAIERANAIYVLGDAGEPAHDARVFLWPRFSRAGFDGCELGKTKTTRLYCALNLESFGLFCQQQRKQPETAIMFGNRSVDINSFNFYDSWAKHLFSRLKVKEGLRYAVSTSRVEIRAFDQKAPCVVIVGFSEMGQAILAELARDCHYASDDNMLITVLDENLDDRRAEFESVYPRIDEIPDIDIDWGNTEKLGSDVFLSSIGNVMDKDRPTTIIVAHDDPAAAVRLALPIMNKANAAGRRVKMLVRQAVKGRYNNWRATNMANAGNQQDFIVFGMLDGAGFGSRKRDDIVETIMQDQQERPGLDIQSCRRQVDALAQILAGLGIEVWSWVPTRHNKSFKSVFDGDWLGKDLAKEDFNSSRNADNMTLNLVKAYHKHWCACYLLSDDGSGILNRRDDCRLVKFEELCQNTQSGGMESLCDELRILFNALRKNGLHLVKRISK